MKKMYKLKQISVIILCLIIFSGLVYSDVQGTVTESGQFIGPGTFYKNVVIQNEKDRFVINMIETDPSTRFIKLETSDGGNPITSKTVLSQAIAKSDRGKRSRVVIGAVNGDFFDMKTVKGLPYGTSIIDQEIRVAVQESTVFGVASDGSCFIDNLKMDGSVSLADSAGSQTSYGITSINKLLWSNQLAIYTRAFGSTTGTKEPGTAVVVKGIGLPLKGNMQYTGMVAQVLTNTMNTPIPQDGIVIAGQGQAADFLKNAAAGGQIGFYINLGRNDIRYAVSGFPRLIENGQASSEIGKRADAKERHPRTAIAMKQGKVYMLTIDGRQPGVSSGVTLFELADYLLSLGMENAVNLDGGGSTTIVARKQGQALPGVANVPSEGSQRAIGNTILIVSEAPVSEPRYINFKSGNIKIFTNSSFKPSFYAMDEYYNLLTLDSKAIKYSTDKTASVSSGGIYKAGSKAAQSYVEVAAGKASARLPVTIVDKVGRLVLDNEFVHLEPGEKVQLRLKAFDENGRGIIIDPSAVKWLITGALGRVDSKGIFTAGQRKGSGKISVKIDQVTAELGAIVGKSPIMLSAFENTDYMELRTIRSQGALMRSLEGEPLKSGKASVKLQYDFTGQTGISATYAVFREPLKIIGKPIKVGAWVYGDGGSHWLRATYINAQGTRKTINLTEEGGLDWKGWKFAYANIPSTEKFPIAFEQIYLAEASEKNKNAGAIFMDELISIYKYEKDIYSPDARFEGFKGSAAMEKAPSEMVFDVSDYGTGINPASIRLYLNDKPVRYRYSAKTGKLTYIPPAGLAEGSYELRLQLRDKAGNTLNPECKVDFAIKKKAS